MRIVEPGFEVCWVKSGEEMLKSIERAGRTSYKSEAKIDETSAVEFVTKIMKRGHYSVIEHESVSVRVIVDRGISHEIVRHRLASYTQESTRYCNYSDEKKFGKEITVIKPSFSSLTDDAVREKVGMMWEDAMRAGEHHYFALLGVGATPQEARSVLPTCLKTEILMTLNLRAWRHFFFLRAAPPAHPDLRRISVPMLEEFRKHIPIIFDTVEE